MEDLNKRFFFQKGITTPQDIKGLCCKISNACKLCLHHLVNHEPNLYFQFRKVGLSLNLPICSTLSLDVMHLSVTEEYFHTSQIQKISVIVYNLCNYLQTKPLPKNLSDKIAKHILKVIQETERLTSI